MVFLGAGLGGVSRFYLAEWTHAQFSERLAGMPIGTLAVNLIGSFVIGIAAAIGGDHLHVKHLLIIGFLGGFTTFSSFSRDAVELMQEGKHGVAATYVGLSLVTCVLGAWLGMLLGRSFVAE